MKNMKCMKEAMDRIVEVISRRNDAFFVIEE